MKLKRDRFDVWQSEHNLIRREQPHVVVVIRRRAK